MKKGFLILNVLILTVIAGLKAQHIKVSINKDDFKSLNEIMPFTYTVTAENHSQDTFFYYDARVQLSFLDKTQNKWVKADIWDNRMDDIVALTARFSAGPTKPKFIPPHSSVTFKSINTFYTSPRIDSAKTPIIIKPNTLIKVAILFKAAGKGKVDESDKVKISLMSQADTDKRCIEWLKQQKNPYFLFQNDLWDRNYISKANKDSIYMALDDYIITNFPNSRFAPWAKFHRACIVTPWGINGLEATIAANIALTEELVSNNDINREDALFMLDIIRRRLGFQIAKPYKEMMAAKDKEKGLNIHMEYDARISPINAKINAKILLLNSTTQ